MRYHPLPQLKFILRLLHATTAVMTSPAPVARARSVQAAIASDNYNFSEIKVIPPATYSSTVADIKLNIKYMTIKEKGMNIIKYPSNVQYIISKKLNRLKLSPNKQLFFAIVH